MMVLKRPEVETSATLLLAPGRHHALEWAFLRQVDVFALLGWLVMAWGGRSRGQVRWLGAISVCGALFAAEAITRLLWSLFVEAGMRLTLVPEL